MKSKMNISVIILGILLVGVGMFSIFNNDSSQKLNGDKDKPNEGTDNDSVEEKKQKEKMCDDNYLKKEFKNINFIIDDKTVTVPFWKCVEEIEYNDGKRFHSAQDRYVFTLTVENSSYEEVSKTIYQSLIDSGFDEYDEMRNLLRKSPSGISYKIVSKIDMDEQENVSKHIHNILYPITDNKIARVEVVYNGGRFDDEFLYEIEDGIIIE